VVVNDFDFVGIAISPRKANPPLSVDPQTPLPFPATLQRFQAVARWFVKFFEPRNPMDLPQLAKGNALKRRIPPTVAMVEHLLGIFIGKRANHA
jgi:hypothetical protein